ncbi:MULTISPECIES: hypothetical protein [Aeromonas]|uniref:hypothetical protein n=1 Tax=Aeromonas TaxID=642 RepID=UPI00191E0FCA|nr:MULTISPECIES: hypothetical protein [Aeromonas]MBL0505151.1 hypothetical protein [Aeromonas veronii]MBW3761390.1 hypothetical protein [Aeromonas jandaei]MCX0426560.1 hypothetical protein [Aeromonas veronii]QWZ85330.1 hypothetical protein I6L34_21710 [Aeromonas sp. FDAARGOS 1404]QWZ85338.1 hypothetical protein I6L34_21750 [Aeromonas sp. FDAARGOS 1404]
MSKATINFDYRSGVLDAAWVERQLEFFWFKGDQQVLVYLDRSEVDNLSVPVAASVVQVKSIIRQYVRGKA